MNFYIYKDLGHILYAWAILDGPPLQLGCQVFAQAARLRIVFALSWPPAIWPFRV